MNAKYVDAVETSEILAYFETLPGGILDLPRGTAGAAQKIEATVLARNILLERACNG
jgi:hypothetical protein